MLLFVHKQKPIKIYFQLNMSATEDSLYFAYNAIKLDQIEINREKLSIWWSEFLIIDFFFYILLFCRSNSSEIYIILFINKTLCINNSLCFIFLHFCILFMQKSTSNQTHNLKMALFLMEKHTKKEKALETCVKWH